MNLNNEKKHTSSKKPTVLLIVATVTLMLGLSYASVPLYDLFCRVTGYGGTTQVASQKPSKIVDRRFTVRLDSNVDPDLNWKFGPKRRSVNVLAGENVLAYYTAQNTGDTPLTGTATFNVTPDKAGIYFNKIECFCFQEQLLGAQQKVDMPVSFFIDPEIVNDPNLEGVTTITLSYTFFKSEDKPKG